MYVYRISNTIVFIDYSQCAPSDLGVLVHEETCNA